MKRILACLATLALGAAASAANAQATTHDPIGDIVTAVSQSAAESAADWTLKATLYHGGGGMSTRDSLGCKVSPMRTVAIDRGLITRGAILFIKETVGLLLPGGGRHDGYWYASDTGRLIKGARIDLFTGPGAVSMGPLEPLNLKTLTVKKVGQFGGCPPVDGSLNPAKIAKADGASGLDERALEHEIAWTGHRPFVEAAPDEQGLEVSQDGWAAAKHQPVETWVDFRQPDIPE